MNPTWNYLSVEESRESGMVDHKVSENEIIII
jgi:hypothetical protein